MSIIPLLHKHGKSEPVGLSELSPIFAIIAFVALWRVLSHLTAFSNLPPFYIPFSSFLFLALHLSLSPALDKERKGGRRVYSFIFQSHILGVCRTADAGLMLSLHFVELDGFFILIRLLHTTSVS